MSKHSHSRQAARGTLWVDREMILPHLLEHKDCGVYNVVVQLCETAGWTLDSYVLAAVFNHEDLLVEVTK